MTRKDYILIADALVKARASCISYTAQEGVNRAANEIAHSLKAENPRFDKSRFLEAAGLIHNDE